MKSILYLILLFIGFNVTVEAQVNQQTPAKAASIDTFSHGNFTCSFIYHPAGHVRGIALMLTKHEALANAQEAHCNVNTVSALTGQEASIAQALSNNGVLVAVLDIHGVLADQADGGDCLNIDGDLDNFSRVMQARYQLPTYQTPILVGVDQMASWVYTRLAVADKQVYSGGISVNFTPQIIVKQPICQGRTLLMNPPAYDDSVPAPATKKASKKPITYHILPSADLGLPWAVIPEATTTPANLDKVKAFIAKVGSATLMTGAGSVDTTDALVLKAFDQIAPHDIAVPPPAKVADLPIIELPSKAPVKANNDVLAIMLSGDGGWAGIDKDLGSAINKAGIPVIGFDSLRYFWKARTPDSTAKDVVRLIQYYQSQPQWKRSKILLIGYSQGADVLPFVVNRLPADIKKQLAHAAFLSLGRTAAFEFHVTNWITSNNNGLPIAPEVAKIGPGVATCIYGSDDDDALCPDLKPGQTTMNLIKLPGDHHFDGDYDTVAKKILTQLHS